MRRKKYTLVDNIVSAAIGVGIMGLMVPHIITARASVEPIIVSPRCEMIDVSEKNVEDDIIVIEPLIIEPLDIDNVPNIITEETTEETSEVLETSVEPYLSYVQEDIYCLGNAMWQEIGILFKKCSKENAERAVYMTGSCIVNRAKMNYMHFGRSIKKQLNPSQYASYSKITEVKEAGVPERIYEIAEDLLRDGPVVSERLVFQAEFPQGEVVEHIYNQYFGLLSEKEYKYYCNN